MTDPAVKIASAFCVILAGVCASALFRHKAPAPTPAPNEPMPAAIQVRPPAPAVPQADVSPPDGRKALMPIRPASETFLDNAVPAAGRPAPTAGDGIRIHRIVDGDSLESLAEYYLGFSSRAGEIFEANRSVLSDPEMLPIGVDLRIPPTGPRFSQPLRP